MHSLTPHASVNDALHDLLANTQAILHEHFRGMYLIGSLALGDFSPASSDIDYVVVTDSEIAEHHFLALHDMHARFDTSGAPWAERIEAVYVPKDILRYHHLQLGEAHYPQLEKERTLFRAPLELGWLFQCWTLRERGIVVAGVEPHAVVDPIDPNDMRQATAILVQPWLDRRDDPEWVSWVREGMQPFVVLTLCRLLYTIASGAVASKPGAGWWALKTVESRWSALIERAIAGQAGTATEYQVNDTLAFLDYAADCCREATC